MIVGWRPRAPRVLMCMLAIGGAVSGCAALLDADRGQCEAPADCAALFGGEAAGYACERNICHSVAQCTVNEQCTSQGLHVCLEGHCVECAGASDCGSPTATCVANVCEDPTWGCLDENDARPPPMQPMATFTVSITDPVRQQNIPSMTVRTCVDTSLDPNCTTPSPNSSGSYSTATGLATVTMENNKPVHFRFDSPSDYSKGAYFTNRLSRDMTVVNPMQMVQTQFSQAFFMQAQSTTATTVDGSKAFLNLRIFTCQGQPASGIVFSLARPPLDLITVYNGEDLRPNFDLGATSSAGRAGMLNVPPGQPTTVIATISPTKSVRFEFSPPATTSSVVDLYPGLFPRP